jgi:hypothetical protein
MAKTFSYSVSKFVEIFRFICCYPGLIPHRNLFRRVLDLVEIFSEGGLIPYRN